MYKYRYLFLGGSPFIAIVLLVWFASALPNGKNFLDIPPQWLGVGLLPVVIALFLGGFITKFNGFGIELETALKKQMQSIEFASVDGIPEVPGGEKVDSRYLRDMDDAKKQSMQWLGFTAKKLGYYNKDAIKEYLDTLPNIEYIKIKKPNGSVPDFLPVATLKNKTDDELGKFIEAVEANDIKTVYSESLATITVLEKDNVIDVLRKLRRSQAKFATVISSTGEYVGVYRTKDVERHIADVVLKASQ